MRSAALLVGLSVGCYSPTIPTGVACDPATNHCPAGQTCRASTGGFACASSDGELDAASSPDAADDATSTDAPVSDAPMSADAAMPCYGTGLVQNLCLAQAPTGTLTVSTTLTIDTNLVGANQCTQIVAQVGGPSLCVLARQAITVQASGKIVASGGNPLVVVTTGALIVAGEIDVSSHRGGSTGPGARASCTAGLSGTGANAPPSGGGGGGGGGFAGAGASGGLGRGSTSGGTGGTAMAPTRVLGGCAGGTGGAGAGGGGAGAGGAGGGAFYAIASSITISGTVRASGAGGAGGGAGTDSGGGAGGGGSGGMIGLDAPMIGVTGAIHANGGGGGGGNGDDVAHNGGPGADPTTATLPAAGGTGGTGGGGVGGAGFAQGAAPQAGSTAAQDYCGGGGGGGGAGVVRVFQVAPGSLGGTISPSPI